MQFLDVKTDFAFKKVFGSEQSKGILISFLNSLIDFYDDNKIIDLTIVDPYQIPLLKGMKNTYVDVKAMLSNGTKVIIEMQVLNIEGFEKRILYNAAKSYSTQLERTGHYTSLEPVIALTITDFIMFKDIENLITYFQLREKETLIEYNGDIELIFIELPKFNKTEKELETITDKWIYFIQNSGSLEYIPETMKDSEIIEAFDIANIAGLNEEEYEIQFKRKDFIYLQQGATKKAREEGREKGREEGERKREIEIAKMMLKENIELSLIVKTTGLAEEEILKLKNKL